MPNPMQSIADEKGKRWALMMIAAQAADEKTYARLLRELQQYLEAYLRKRWGSAAFIDDLVQECLIAVHRARHTFEPERPFLPWFHAIVRFKGIDALRARKRLQSHELMDESALEKAFVTWDPELAKYGLDDELLAALEALPPKQKEAVQRMKMQGLSVKETAQHMKMSESAVKVTAHRAYEALRRRLTGGR